MDLEPSVQSPLFGSEVLIDLRDVDELGVIDVVAGAFESDRGAAGGEDVLEPVGVRPIGQGNDEPVVGRRCDDRRVVAASAGSPGRARRLRSVNRLFLLNGARAVSSPARCVERR